jgi:hypothetical protein
VVPPAGDDVLIYWFYVDAFALSVGVPDIAGTGIQVYT